MIELFQVHCLFGIFSCYLIFLSCRSLMSMFEMDDNDDDFSTCEIVVETSRIEKTRTYKRSKKPNPKFYNYLLKCLDEDLHPHMLRYVSLSKNEFEVIFTDRKNKKVWKRSDISLFIDCDKHLQRKFNRKRSEMKYEDDVKIRFKSNMCKCEQKFIKKVKETKIGKCKTVKRYKIIWRPHSVGDCSNNERNDGKNKRKSYKKNYKSNCNEEICVKKGNDNAISDLENDPQKSSNEAINILNMLQDGKNKIELKDNTAFQKMQENESHYLCLTKIFQNPEKRDSQSTLDCFDNMEVNGNVYMGNEDFLENLKILLNPDNFIIDDYVSSKDLNCPNVEIESFTGNLDAYTNFIIDGYVSSKDLSYPNVEIESFSGNLDADTNFIIDGYVSSKDFNYSNAEMESFTENLDDYANNSLDDSYDWFSDYQNLKNMGAP